MPSNDFVCKIIKEDRKTFLNDFQNEKFIENNDVNNNISLISDFTEYSPLHNGHFYCMNQAKLNFPDSLFVAIVPGLFERSGRGLPYILHRKKRAEIAIAVGADIVVEGPPMGIMGSGQYSLSLAKMFQALNTDHLPRGYKEKEGFDEILNRIKLGHPIYPKPYKIVDKYTGEVLLKDKLEEDNYVIVSFSKSLHKIGFDFKDKFFFVKRIEGVSGTLIREAVAKGNFDDVKSMLPKETIKILKREIDADNAPLHNILCEKRILESANNLTFDELSKLNLFSDNLAKIFIENRPFTSLNDIKKIITRGFSKHFQTRILSVLESRISKEIISQYIDGYPQVIRVLDYKNKEKLELFKEKILNKNIKFYK